MNVTHNLMRQVIFIKLMTTIEDFKKLSSKEKNKIIDDIIKSMYDDIDILDSIIDMKIRAMRGDNNEFTNIE